MKIAIFTDLYTPGGATGGIISSISAQKAELEKLGHEVTVFCPGLKTAEKHVFLVPTFARPKINGALMSRSPKIVTDFIRKNYSDFDKFDVVHVHYEASCSIAGILLAKEFNLPLAQTMHGREDMAIAINVPRGARTITATGLNQLHRHYLPHDIKVKADHYQAPNQTRAKMWQLMINHANCADVIITPSNHFRRKLEHYGVDKPIEVVPNGLPPDFTEPDFPIREYHDGDVLKLIWNSRVSTEKRFIPFLRVLRKLNRPYMFYVYGDGNVFKKAQAYAKKYQMKVKFFGAKPRNQIIARMKSCHLSVCTSYNFDTQGMILIEAEATGLPTFLCDPDLAEDLPRGGYLLAAKPDVETMAMTLNKLTPEQIAKMSKVMLDHRQETAQSAQIEKLLSAYKIAIKGRRSKITTQCQSH